jgi:hypothetical protein
MTGWSWRLGSRNSMFRLSIWQFKGSIMFKKFVDVFNSSSTCQKLARASIASCTARGLSLFSMRLYGWPGAATTSAQSRCRR